MLRQHPLALLALALAVAPPVPAAAQAPGVEIHAIRAEGGLSVAAARAAVSRGLGGLRACYEARLREAPSLVTAMRLRVHVSDDGEPAAAAVDAATVEDAALRACVVERASAWTFPASSGAPTDVFVVLRFGGGDASRLDAAAAPQPHGAPDTSRETPGIRPDPVPPMESQVIVGEPVVRGALAPHEVRRALARRAFTLRRCYELGLRARPELAGHLVLRFAVGADGRVSRAAVDAGSLAEPRVAACVERLVRRLELPAPSSGAGAEIEATVSFRPAPAAGAP